jgi:hypothetical protein
LLRQFLVINESMLGRLQLSEVNIYAHLGHATAAQYLSMHIARLLCEILIHWELLPFLPLRCQEPSGPLGQNDCFRSADAPCNFWKTSARDCFGAAKAILDLELSCQTLAPLSSNVFTAYGLFVANFLKTYGRHFPWMDPDDQMSTYNFHDGGNGENRSQSPTSRAQRRQRAEGTASENVVHRTSAWMETLEIISQYFGTFKRDFHTNVSTCIPASTLDQYGSGNKMLCLRDGGYGGGSEEYDLFRERLFNFGSL